MKNACWLVVLSLLVKGGRSSLDFEITHDGGVSHERIVVDVYDWQTGCLGLDSAVQHVGLECSLRPGGNVAEYRSHCVYADSGKKARQCCIFCCSPMNDEEIWKLGQIDSRQRCKDSRTYCAREKSYADGCGQAWEYEDYLAAAQQLVVETWPEGLQGDNYFSFRDDKNWDGNNGPGIGEVTNGLLNLRHLEGRSEYKTVTDEW